MEPAPPPWLIFVIMFGLISVTIGVIVVIGGTSRFLRGESFWPEREPLSAGQRALPTRSRVRPMRAAGRSVVRAGSAAANAALAHQDAAFAGSLSSRSGSDVRENAPPMGMPGGAIAPELPQNIDELIWALAALHLRNSGNESTKEAAIIRAFPNVSSKGASPAWQRASKLYDIVQQAQRVALNATREATPTEVQPDNSTPVAPATPTASTSPALVTPAPSALKTEPA